MKFEIGDQIMYFPAHVNHNPNHPECEFGFVTNITDLHVFCRFWETYSIFEGETLELRTKSNSEGIVAFDLEKFHSVSDEDIEAVLVDYNIKLG